LWIFVPLMVLAVAITIWWMRRAGGGISEDDAKRLVSANKELQEELDNTNYYLFVHEAQGAWRTGNAERTLAHLRAAERSMTTDETPFEWNYLHYLIKGHRQLLLGHEAPIDAAVISPDSKMVVSADADGVILLWDATTGKLRTSLKGHEGAVHSLAFAVDGKTLASAGEDGTVRLWGLTDGAAQAPRVLKGHAGPVLSLAFSRDGAALASGGADKVAIIWFTKKDAEPIKLTGHAGPVHSVAFGAGQTLATA